MGKTYRHSPVEQGELGWWEERAASEEVRRKRKVARERRAEAQPQQEAMDISWAVERMKEHIAYIVGKLVDNHLIEEGEREEYAAVFTAVVCESWPEYDPERRGEKSGRTASPVHFLTMKVDSKLANVMDYLAYRRWSLRFYSLTDDRDAAREDEGSVWSGDRCLSDECRGVRQLEFRMDVLTLVSMLTAEERMTLAMRIAGYTDIEIAEALSLTFRRRTDRHRVQKVHAVHMQEKARRCGFFPPSEARGRE